MSDSQLSLNKAEWVMPDVDLAEVEAIVRAYDVPEIVARMLIGRGVSFDDVARFLNPTLKADFPDPFSLKGMTAFAEDMAAAIAEKKQFAIFGDFDVDGATSSAVLYRFLKHCGIEAPIYIPGRLPKGMGRM